MSVIFYERLCTSSHSINLLLTNNNHFDLLSIKGKSESKEYRKITKKEFKIKKKAVIKRNEKDHSMKGEQSTIYSKNTCKSIKDYLISGVYPSKNLSVEPFEARKQRKRGFRKIIDKDKRYKIEESKTCKGSVDLFRNWNWRLNKKKQDGNNNKK